jgi:hypothetical protein
MKMSPLNVWCALIPLTLLAPSIAISQEKRGTVRVDSLDVYSRMSTDSDVVQSLSRGTVVRVLLSVTGSDGEWCGVANQGSASRIGYVTCSALDRPKEVPPAVAQAGAIPKMIIMQSFTPIETSSRIARRQTNGSPDDTGGETLAPLPGYSWNSYPKTLVIAIRRGCPYCDASMPFYRRLGEQEKTNMIRAHVLVVMPNDASSGGSLLSTNDVEVQAIFGQRLGALKVAGTPTVLLVDSNGHIERTWVGQLPSAAEKDVMNAAGE